VLEPHTTTEIFNLEGGTEPTEGVNGHNGKKIRDFPIVNWNWNIAPLIRSRVRLDKGKRGRSFSVLFIL
jgi:hypothetical protein